MIRNEVVIDEKFIRENMNYFGHESDLKQSKKIKNMKIIKKVLFILFAIGSSLTLLILFTEPFDKWTLFLIIFFPCLLIFTIFLPTNAYPLVRKSWEKFALKLFHEYINKKIFIYTDEGEIQISSNYRPGIRILKWSSIKSYHKNDYYLRLFSDIQGRQVEVCYDMSNFKTNDLEALLTIIERNKVQLLS